MINMFKICGIDNKIWHFFFIFSMLTNSLLVVIALSNAEWMKQNYKQYNSTSQWQGGLLMPQTSNDNDYNWRQVYNYCGHSTFCKQYLNFYIGGIFYIAFSIPELIMMLGATMINFIYLMNKKNLIQTYSFKIANFFVFMANLLHFVAFTLWAALVKLETNCSYEIGVNSPQPVCPLIGADLSILSLCLITVTTIIHFIVSKPLISKYSNQDIADTLTRF